MTNKLVVIIKSLEVPEGGQHHAPANLSPVKTPDTCCTGDWVGLGGRPERHEESRSQRDSINGPYIPKQVAIPTGLSRPGGGEEKLYTSRNKNTQEFIDITYLLHGAESLLRS